MNGIAIADAIKKKNIPDITIIVFFIIVEIKQLAFIHKKIKGRIAMLNT
jgi:hypothetical protein